MICIMIDEDWDGFLCVVLILVIWALGNKGLKTEKKKLFLKLVWFEANFKNLNTFEIIS